MSRVTSDARFYVRLGWLMTLLGFGGFMAWASLAPLDQGVAVQGTVVVSGKRKAVQSMAAGVVSRILVSEGQVVRQGEPLFRLDRTQVQADVEALQAQYRMTQASLARWRGERDNAGQVQFPAELMDESDAQLGLVVEGQRQLFDSRRQALAREQGAVSASIEGSQAQLAGMRRARGDLQAQADSLREQLDNLRPLAGEGYIPRNRVLEYQRQLSQVQRDLAQNAGDSARLEQLNSARFELRHSEILAPADGIAVNLGVHTEGAVVRAGDTLLEIVPQGTALEVEGRLPVNLVDKVAPQLPVDILFTAFNQNSTPRVTGEVALISADQLLDERSGQPYYVLRSTVSEEALARLQGLSIRPGMPAELFVRTGERSLLNYLFKPLLDRAGSALTEQ